MRWTKREREINARLRASELLFFDTGPHLAHSEGSDPPANRFNEPLSSRTTCEEELKVSVTDRLFAQHTRHYCRKLVKEKTQGKEEEGMEEEEKKLVRDRILNQKDWFKAMGQEMLLTVERKILQLLRM